MLVVDGEFSGLDFEKHSIVSWGAIDLENPENQFYAECRVWDGAHINSDSLAITGFSEAEVTDKNKMSEGELVRNFIDWSKTIKNRTLAGQNVSADRDILKAATHRAGYDWDFAFRSIDTHTLCWMHMVKRGFTPPINEEHQRSALNLDAVLNYCGIPSEPEPHNALTGAKCHAEVISRLLYDKKLLPEFAHLEIPWL